jgi:RES domain-containing protein
MHPGSLRCSSLAYRKGTRRSSRLAVRAPRRSRCSPDFCDETLVLSAWRLTRTRHLATAWDGEGARLAGGRWNSVGVRAVYASGSLSLALVEILVHLPSGVLPAYSAVPVELDEAVVEMLDPSALPASWMAHPPPREAQAVGDRWVEEGRSAALRVPSVIVPSEFNYVLNPAHADFRKIRIGAAVPFPFDARLATRGGGK